MNHSTAIPATGKTPAPQWTLTLRADAGHPGDPIARLRYCLKRMRRSYGIVCTGYREIPADAGPVRLGEVIPDALQELGVTNDR
ncbi:MAG: hypothetical protein SFV23_17595 [Planctomycetaceae bacterium]|nr:hypothetical protein [Planctomycetaceae bacterium]